MSSRQQCTKATDLFLSSIPQNYVYNILYRTLTILMVNADFLGKIDSIYMDAKINCLQNLIWL